MKRLTIGILIVFGVVAAFVSLHRFYSRKFYVTTGKAQWIWDQHRLASERPVVFFATRDFEVPPNRQYVHIKVAADPEYVLYFNGQPLGGRRFRGTGVIDRYDVTEKARPGKNRIVISVRSAKGVGGVLAAVDLAPMLENIVVSDQQWKLFHVWSDELLRRDPPQFRPVRPRVLGSPPIGRWDYLSYEVDAPKHAEPKVLQAVDSIQFEARLPVIKVASGVAVASFRRTTARAFDFGAVKGRARVEVEPVGKLVAKIRYANDPAELGIEGEVIPLPLAPGERSVVDPEERRFRYVIVYDIEAKATVLTE